MNLFLSYRRFDSQDIAARMADRLREVVGIKKVFIDVGGITPGANFVERIAGAMEESDVCLVLIGTNWIGAEKPGAPPRIKDPEDFVHREVAAALAGKKRTIPVLLNNASMPSADALPEDIRELASLSALFVRHASFDQDIQWLEDVLFLRRTGGGVSRFFRFHPTVLALLRGLRGLAIAGGLLLILAALHHALTGGQALEQTLGSQGAVWLIIIASLVLGLIASVFFSRRP